MTIVGDNLYVGDQAPTSAKATYAPTMLTRMFDMTGNGTTVTFTLPPGSENLDAKCYIVADGSAATTDSITVSAGGTTLLTFSSMGSVQGLVKGTQAGLGTLVVVASACDSLSATAETTCAATLASTDAACAYRLVFSFNKARQQVD